MALSPSISHRHMYVISVIYIPVKSSHTPFCKRGKGSGNFFYSSLLCLTAECRTNHSTVFCYMSADIPTVSRSCHKESYQALSALAEWGVYSYARLVTIHSELAIPSAWYQAVCCTEHVHARMTSHICRPPPRVLLPAVRTN